MSLGALAGVVLTLAVVLGLMAVALRLVRRVAGGTAGGRGRLPLEVVQRLALGPKQGIAVVRIGERLMAVSLGEGGIRPLAELGEAERALLAAGAPASHTADVRGAVNAARTLGGRLAAMVGHRAPAAAATSAPLSTTVPVEAPVTDTPTAVAPRPMARRAALLSPLPPVRVVPEVPDALRPTAAHAPVPAPHDATPARERPDAGSPFHALLQTALRGGAAALALAVVLGAAAARPAAAQGAAATPPASAPAATSAATPAAGMPRTPTPSVVPRRPADARMPAAPATRPAPATTAQPAQPGPGREPPPLARVDTMITRLAPQMELRMGGGEEQGGLRLSGTVGVVVMMGLLTLLPTLLLMMTGFTRILIVLHFLRQALGTQSAPPAHLVAGLALLLTGFVMAPTLHEVNETAITPWLDGRIEQAEMLKTGVKPFRAFMLRQTRDSDIRAFLDMSQTPEPASVEEVPLVVLTSAFVTSELRTAFQIGFALFLPFIVIDVVVSSVLMSMGMFMLPPAMISLPFKLLLFVLVDGWTLLTQSLIQSFH